MMYKNVYSEVKRQMTRGRGWIRVMMVAVAMVIGMAAASAQSCGCTSTRMCDDHRHALQQANPTLPVEEPTIRTEWSLGIGGTYTGVRQRPLTDGSMPQTSLQPRFSLQGHVDMAVLFGRNFAIEMEICYEGGSLTATKSEGKSEISHRVKSRTVDIPLLLSARLLRNRIRLNVGPVFTVMSRAEYTHDGEVMHFGPIYPTWNIAAGIGVGFARNVIVEARYIHALKSSLNQFMGEEFDTDSYRISVGISLLF